MKPTICAWLICKNEARDIPRALRSIDAIVDRIVIVDTGSTDNTEAAARAAVTKPITFETYTGASELVDGDWRLVNFAKARNRACELAEASGCSHIFWMDSDDELLTPKAALRTKYLPNDAAYGIWIELGGGVRQVHYRVWNADARVRFKGWCHEYAVLGSLKTVILDDCAIRHDPTPHGAGEDSNARNRRILEAQYKVEPDARCAFYLANTHKDAARWAEAVEWYDKRLAYGDGFKDEYLFALLYKGRAQRAAGDAAGALATLATGEALSAGWAEFTMERAFIEYTAGRYSDAIVAAVRCLDAPVPQTVLWRERCMYSDQPARLISWCFEHAGDLPAAIAWSEKAAARIGAPDADWAARQSRLAGQHAARNDPPPAIITGARPRIALHRPGAIGDIIMTLNLIPALREANPDHDIDYFCDARLGAMDALGGFILQAGCSRVMDSAHADSWRKSYARWVDLIGYPLAEGYPDQPMRDHLLHYFARELGLPVAHPLTPSGQALPSLTLPIPGAPWYRAGGYATLQIKAGWSAYKEWGADKWAAVVAALPDIPFAQIGAKDCPRIAGASDFMLGATLRESIAAIAGARLHVGVDSFGNHLTNYFWQDAKGGGRRVPGVILWGSTQASAAGYPGNTNISKGLHCQPCFKEDERISRHPRGICNNPPWTNDERGRLARYYGDGAHACMAAISVEEVIEAIRAKWQA